MPLLGPVPLENVGNRKEFLSFSLDATTSLNRVSWVSSLCPLLVDSVGGRPSLMP
ncbi:hypothetical protein [Erythrobacter sp. QSSC1-22B]|uniref:hypothetical protein n=1 Tax=Erythrobacter sp. QSSC1-22B TaxID=1860125 RepID=UPI00143A3448|nr:hypothetical protein [Erythrobacter sp. QSSC1-22B]